MTQQNSILRDMIQDHLVLTCDVREVLSDSRIKPLSVLIVINV